MTGGASLAVVFDKRRVVRWSFFQIGSIFLTEHLCSFRDARESRGQTCVQMTIRDKLTVSADAGNVKPGPRVPQSQPGEHDREDDRYETPETTSLVPEHSSRLAKVWRVWLMLVSSAVEKTELRIGGRISDKRGWC